MATTVLLADDQELIREGLRALLEKQEDMRVVGDATDGVEAVDMAHDLHPDVVLMDVSMPRMDGIEATRRIVATLPETRVVALSIHSDRRYVQSMARAGARGYLTKDRAHEEVVAAIRKVIEGGGHWPNDVSLARSF